MMANFEEEQNWLIDTAPQTLLAKYSKDLVYSHQRSSSSKKLHDALSFEPMVR